MDNIIEFGSIEKEISFLKMYKFINEVIIIILEKDSELEEEKLREIHDIIFDLLKNKEIKIESFFSDYMIEVCSVSIFRNNLNLNSFIIGLKQFDCTLNDDEKDDIISRLNELTINNKRRWFYGWKNNY